MEEQSVSAETLWNFDRKNRDGRPEAEEGSFYVGTSRARPPDLGILSWLLL